jgi:hypothetical protein
MSSSGSMATTLALFLNYKNGSLETGLGKRSMFASFVKVIRKTSKLVFGTTRAMKK